MTAPTRQRSSPRTTDESIYTAIEQVRSTLGANGAFVAVRESQGLRALQTAGNVPAGAAERQLDSEFTRECVEANRVTICEDSQRDLRIRLDAARLLLLRSAIAVPVEFHGTLIGVIELFSSLPSAFSSAHAATLQEIGNLLAPLLASHAPGGAEASSATTGREASAAASVEPRSKFHTVAMPAVGRERVRVAPDSELLRAEPARRISQSPLHSKDEVAVSASGSAFSVQSGRSGSPRVRFRWRRFLLGTNAGRTMVLGIGVACVALALFAVTRYWPEISRGKVNSAEGAQTSGAVSRVKEAPVTRVPPPAPPLPAARPQTLVGGAASHEAARSQESRPLALPSSSHSSVPTAAAKERSPVAEVASAASESVSRNESARAQNMGPSSEAPSSSATVPATVSRTLPPVAVSKLPAAIETNTPIVDGSLLKTRAAARPDFVLDHTVRGHASWVTGVAFTSDGKRLISGSWDQTVKMWDVPSGAAVATVNNGQYVQALATSRDGHYFAAENSRDNVTLWDATTGRALHTLATDRQFHGAGSNWVYSIAFSPDNRLLASAIDDKTVRLWDVHSGQVVRDLSAGHRSVIYIAFSPDGRWLASGANDKSIVIWDVASGQAVRTLKGHRKTVYAVAFSPDGRWLASASADKSVKIWDVNAGREIRTFTGHSGLVTTLAFSPDGRWLASGSWDKTIKIWDVDSGAEVQTLGGYAHSIYAIAFDPRGRWIASGSEDGTIKLWHWNYAGASRD